LPPVRARAWRIRGLTRQRGAEGSLSFGAVLEAQPLDNTGLTRLRRLDVVEPCDFNTISRHNVHEELAPVAFAERFR